MTKTMKCAQWFTPKTIVQGAKIAKFSNASSSPAAACVLLWVKQDDYIVVFLYLEMRSEHILPATLAFLNLTITGIEYYESRDPCVYHRGIEVPYGTEGPLGVLKPISEALFLNVNCIEQLKIVRDFHSRVTESWMAFQRSHEIDWSRCIMET